jgi:hypothetical protein
MNKGRASANRSEKNGKLPKIHLGKGDIRDFDMT